MDAVPNGSRQIRSVVKAIHILECLSEARRPLSLDELARRTGYPKSTLHGLLCTMVPSAVVEQSPDDGKYRLGIRLFEFGCVFSSTRSVVTASRGIMQHIAFQTDESICLSTLDRNHVMVLDQSESSSAYHVASEPGARLPLHCTSQGKVFLAYQGSSFLNRALDNGLQAYTTHTICDRNALKQDLEQTRKQGFAIENGEFRVGLRSVAAPIFDSDGEVRYALAIIGMFRRVQSEEFEQATALVIEGAGKISSILGYRRNPLCMSF